MLAGTLTSAIWDTMYFVGHCSTSVVLLAAANLAIVALDSVFALLSTQRVYTHIVVLLLRWRCREKKDKKRKVGQEEDQNSWSLFCYPLLAPPHPLKQKKKSRHFASFKSAD